MTLGYRILAYILIAAALFGFGYTKGVTSEEKRQAATLIEQERQSRSLAAVVGRQHADAMEKLRRRMRTLNRKIDDYAKKPIAVTECLDVDAVGLWNEYSAPDLRGGASYGLPGDPQHAAP